MSTDSISGAAAGMRHLAPRDRLTLPTDACAPAGLPRPWHARKPWRYYCWRLSRPSAVYSAAMPVNPLPNLAPSWNVAPTQDAQLDGVKCELVNGSTRSPTLRKGKGRWLARVKVLPAVRSHPRHALGFSPDETLFSRTQNTAEETTPMPKPVHTLAAAWATFDGLRFDDEVTNAEKVAARPALSRSWTSCWPGLSRRSR